jgi:hypothetical protein
MKLSLFSSPLVSYSNDVASISKARFVTAGAISMKLGVKIPLGNMPRAFCDLTYLTHLEKSTKSYYS